MTIKIESNPNQSIENAPKRYIGLSGETKPVNVPVGSILWVYDTNIEYKTYDGDNWVARGSIPQQEYFFWPVVAGNLTDGGVQYSGTVVTVEADTDYTLALGTFEPPRTGKIEGKTTGGRILFSLAVGLAASAGGPGAKVTIQARNKGGTWVDLLPLTANIATTSTELIKAYSGYFPTVANLNAVPFDLQLKVRSDSAVNTITARVTNASFVQGIFEAGS